MQIIIKILTILCLMGSVQGFAGTTDFPSQQNQDIYVQLNSDPRIISILAEIQSQLPKNHYVTLSPKIEIEELTLKATIEMRHSNSNELIKVVGIIKTQYRYINGEIDSPNIQIFDIEFINSDHGIGVGN